MTFKSICTTLSTKTGLKISMDFELENVAVCRKPRLRCLSHLNHVVRQVTSLSNSTFLSRDIDALSHDTCVQSLLCDFGLGIFSTDRVTS